ncbi:MAG: M23 family metallopeptidase [Gaiellaceae bacterium]
MRPWYADDYRSWPVAPRNRQHPVRGSWLDPRRKELYHPGIDISVRDDRPERGAPPNRTHRVYALEGGLVWRVWKQPPPGVEGIVRIGHFTYGHVDPVVELGQEVKPGQLIGWTFKDEWHLHLSEWRFPGGKPSASRQIQVNPLDREGKIAPYRDTAPPVIQEIRFYRPVDAAWGTRHGSAVFSPGGARLDPSRLSGQVDVRAHILDRQSFRGWFRDVPLLETDHHPARVHLAVDRATDGKRVVDRDVFPSDVWPGPEASRQNQISISHHYAPGTRQNLRANTAIKLDRQGRGELWFRLFAGPRRKSCYWDTTAFRDGPYRLTVTAWDLVGNSAEESIDVVIANNV